MFFRRKRKEQRQQELLKFALLELNQKLNIQITNYLEDMEAVFDSIEEVQEQVEEIKNEVGQIREAFSKAFKE